MIKCNDCGKAIDTGTGCNDCWMKWQRQVIREEYVEAPKDTGVLGRSTVEEFIDEDGSHKGRIRVNEREVNGFVYQDKVQRLWNRKGIHGLGKKQG